MKKINYLVILLSFICLEQVQAQTKKISTQQGQYSKINNPGSFVASGNTKDYVGEIISVLGLKANFELRAANIPNAAAVIYSGKRYVLYNPEFINTLTKTAGNKWAAVSILAHEVGHHLNGHTLENIGSHPAIELEADEFSGFVLRRMGATLSEAQQAMQIAADHKRSTTHPGKSERLIAIAGGWNNADDQANGRKTDLANTTRIKRGNTGTEAQTGMEVSPDAGNADDENYTIQKSVDARQVSKQIVIDEKYIIGDVSFIGDRGSNYYVTTKFNLIKQYNNQLYILGALSESGNKNYPYVVTLANAQKLWVNSRGNIITTSGLKVGDMRGR